MKKVSLFLKHFWQALPYEMRPFVLLTGGVVVLGVSVRVYTFVFA